MIDLVDDVRLGNRRSIARLISLIENEHESAREAIKILYPFTGNAHIIGITGPPGSGKSTLVNEIAKEMRRSQLTVSIIAVDPSSPFTGGALLGDRIRMRDLAGDDGIFIRSMASRGSLGGLASTTGDIVKILDAAGFEKILIETVGAGQAEVDIASTAHSTVVVEAPGMGDEIQSIKAGILEVADILVVNKADYPGSNKTTRALKAMVHMGSGRSKQVNHHDELITVQEGGNSGLLNNQDWEVPVLETVAIRGTGIEEVVKVIQRHQQHLLDSGGWGAKEIARSRRELNVLLTAEFMRRLQKVVPKSDREAMVMAVARRKIDPYTAMTELFERAGG